MPDRPVIAVSATSDSAKARRILDKPTGFGRDLADLMVIAKHRRDEGWSQLEVVPYRPLQLDPAAKVLHYGLEVFEGHKAYRWPSDEIALFRPELNAERFVRSAQRVALPKIEPELQLEATEVLVDLLRDWVPSGSGRSLYLRPMIIATEASLGVGRSTEHHYLLIAAPVSPFFEGCKPVAIKVETERVRAAAGGVGAAKTGGNYAASVVAAEDAKAEGFDQVLWLDAKEHRYVEELSAMNVFAVIDGVLVTPPASGTILAGITRRSLLEMARHLGIDTSERAIAIDELSHGIRTGRCSELFAAGTAAVVTPIGTLGVEGERLQIGDGDAGTMTSRLREQLLAIQEGRGEDILDWMRVVPKRSRTAKTAVTRRPGRRIQVNVMADRP